MITWIFSLLVAFALVCIWRTWVELRRRVLVGLAFTLLALGVVLTLLGQKVFEPSQQQLPNLAQK
jgi:hypothetical protein